ncbi:Non-repetitive/WGA-negative nucleoporin C-terminal-domain-containing protein [Schizophyllum amplum]|uniref:Non-repetitive/WGA-negative nucleoporin C-terminal-domain-containing protein n=1 Tax=Schizophyllum amplum TaxID=97359 RepID=A0A550C617_9AGAR|nr:Non-repetitive/WGA-negative nucleoporin C-terminal-domain-containing protein [Auriculariopsis ampla]
MSALSMSALGSRDDPSMRPGPSSTPSSPNVDLPAFQDASRVLQEQFVKDSQAIPDLGDTLSIPGQQASAAYTVAADDARMPYQKRTLLRIPDALVQYATSTQVNMAMGLLPEIERAWIALDHQLFLWDYNNGQEINSFVDQPDVIRAVAVVKPKRGLFIEAIHHLLVICTKLSVLLIAVSLTPAEDGRTELNMYATDLSVATDEVQMTSVVGTNDGRIFMCGADDGNLYELHYQESEGWFGKRIQLINHSAGGVQSFLPRFTSSATTDQIRSVVADPDRNMVYTLTASNSIGVYRLGAEKKLDHVQTMSSLFKHAQDKAPAAPALTPQNFELSALHVIEPKESRMGIQLMAVTKNAVRLYFAPAVSYYSYGTYGGGGRVLQLLHVRLPPANLPHPHRQTRSSLRGQPSAANAHVPTFVVSTVENAAYANGLLVASQPASDTNDFILCLSPDLTRIGNLGQLAHNHNQPPQPTYSGALTTGGPPRPPLTEQAVLLDIPLGTWAIAPVKTSAPPAPPETQLPTVINELASQAGESPPQFMIMTSEGLVFVIKRRTIDYLQAIIEDYETNRDIQPMLSFRDGYGRDQTCAMLLELACGNSFVNFNPASSMGATVKQAFFELGERPVWTERVTYGAPTTGGNQGTTTYSGKREGFALYLARLLRPFWRAKLLTPSGTAISVSADVLNTIQTNLMSLKNFLDQNPSLFHSAPLDTSSPRASSNIPEQEALKDEQLSVTKMINLLGRTIEALEFVTFMTLNQLSDLVPRCKPALRSNLAALTFETFITTEAGATVSRELINVLIDQQMSGQMEIDTVSETLQRKCPSFCSAEDVMLYKARESVTKAEEARTVSEQQHWLAESLMLYVKGARTLDLEKLKEAVGRYVSLQFPKGAIELSLACAKALDPDDRGRQYWRNGTPAGDPAQSIYQRRQQCYELIKDCLQTFEAPKAEDAQTRPPEEGLNLVAYQIAFESDDEVFHAYLYQWLIGRGLSEDLLAQRPPFLEAYLAHEPADAAKYELLWMFYIKNGQNLQAAQILAQMAEHEQFELPLPKRVEYLTLAVGNAKSQPISSSTMIDSGIAFLTDLEEKLEVAQVQLEIYARLLPQRHEYPPQAQELIDALDKKLLELNDLWAGYALRFQLKSVQLLCLHVGDVRDEGTVRECWDGIFREAVGMAEDAIGQADHIKAAVVPLGQRFYPSDCAFPLRVIAHLLVRFRLNHKGQIDDGWPARILVDCNVPYAEVWDLFHEMYESQIPPFNTQDNVQMVSSDIAVLLSDWLREARRPQPAPQARGEVPVARLDEVVDQYLREVAPDRPKTRELYEEVRRQLRRSW